MGESGSYNNQRPTITNYEKTVAKLPNVGKAPLNALLETSMLYKQPGQLLHPTFVFEPLHG